MIAEVHVNYKTRFVNKGCAPDYSAVCISVNSIAGFLGKKTPLLILLSYAWHNCSQNVLPLLAKKRNFS